MTSAAERARLVEAARLSIRRGSKSFRFASRLFDRQTRERAWLLYAWCRACDDLADGQVAGHDASSVADPDRQLRYIRARTEEALDGRDTGDDPFDGLRLLRSECPLPRRFIDHHVAGFALDAEGWRPRSEDDLLTYCYHVAGAVGCMMAIVMGVDPEDRETLDRASDLGIAFQLANIARDIGEDHQVGRQYLPGTWLEEKSISPEELMQPHNRASLASLAVRLCSLVDAYEASARVGAAQLPLRSRWSVLSAARIYGAIARKVAARGEAAWNSRTIVPRSAKLGHVLMAGAQALASPPPADRSGLWTRPR